MLVTALQNPEDKIRGLDASADDVRSKPFNAHELRARVRSLIRIKRNTDDLDTAESVIVSLALTIEARDACTEGHCQCLSAYASQLGRSLGLGDDDVAALARGGFLHDIGKVGVPDAVLLKRERLTADGYDVMKQHAAIGDRLCGERRSLRRVRPIVRHHHERLDGSGYPDGLAGDAIPMLAQITGIVDVFDALTTERPYKAALPTEWAYAELLNEAARGWRRRDLVEAFHPDESRPARADRRENGREVIVSSVLVVDDEPAVRRLLRRWLESGGHETAEVADADAALARAVNHEPDVVLCDVRMAGHDGLWLVDQLRRRLPRVAIVLATGLDSVPPAVSLQSGVVAYLIKPFERARVLEAVGDGAKWRERAIAADASGADPITDWLRGQRRPPTSSESDNH